MKYENFINYFIMFIGLIFKLDIAKDVNWVHLNLDYIENSDNYSRIC
jgi:hypothetical protein